MGSQCHCLHLSPSPTVLVTRPQARGTARAWRSACGRWRRRTVRCASSSAWRRAAAPRTTAAITPRPTPWRKAQATARACGLALWRGTARSAGSNQQWKNARYINRRNLPETKLDGFDPLQTLQITISFPRQTSNSEVILLRTNRHYFLD